MDIGILGLPYVGKTTIFNLLTNSDESGFAKHKSEKRVVKVHDERVAKLSEIYKPKKTTYATINFIDIPGLDPSASSKEKNEIYMEIQNVDSLLLVVRTFRDDSILMDEKYSSPLSQLEALKYEMLFRDMEICETRINRIVQKKNKASKEELKQMELIKTIKAKLEDDLMIYQMGLTDEETKEVASFSFFTSKPIVVAFNVDEDQLNNNFDGEEEALKFCRTNNFANLKICGKMEMEIGQLDEDDKIEFLKDLGLKETGIQRLTKVVYDHVGLISFFTVGEDEVRAWTIKKGTTMKKAAGKIHSDLERGFIRAEVVNYEDFIKLGSMKAVRDSGLLRLEGKDTIVQDGDILNIRFNV
jgi:hypothetical protein